MRKGERVSWRGGRQRQWRKRGRRGWGEDEVVFQGQGSRGGEGEREKKVKVSKRVNNQTTRDLPEEKSWWW